MGEMNSRRGGREGARTGGHEMEMEERDIFIFIKVPCSRRGVSAKPKVPMQEGEEKEKSSFRVY